MTMTYEEKQTANAMANAALGVQDDDPYKVRNIELRLTTADMLHMGRHMAGLAPTPSRTQQFELLAAIGYLSSYAIHGDFDNAVIYRDHDDLIGFYTTSAGRRFTMGAIWRPELNKFSFHS